MNAALILALFILLRGSEGNVLKLLQQTGGDHISFCNVFFFFEPDHRSSNVDN